MPRGLDELKHIFMVEIDVQNHSAVFVMAAPAEDLIQGAVDFSEANRARSSKTLSVLCSPGAELR